VKESVVPVRGTLEGTLSSGTYGVVVAATPRPARQRRSTSKDLSRLT